MGPEPRLTQGREAEIDARRVRWSSVALVGSNLIPLVGVLFLGWDLFTIVLAFWMENVVVGIYNVLRMATAQGPLATGRGQTPPALNSGAVQAIGRVGLILFFIVHYGIFTGVHGMFVFVLFGEGGFAQAMQTGGEMSPPLDPGSIGAAYGTMALRLGLMFWALMISHGVSYVGNYLGGKEYLTASPGDLFGQPYSRIVVLHLTILLGAFLVVFTHYARAPIVLLVALKIGVDLAAHRRERLKFATLKAQRLAAAEGSEA
jgi:hypothetical protein